jgi:hypothetical protein
MSFHSCTANPFPASDPTAADAIPVIFENFEAKSFGGVLARQYSRKAMPEAPPAIPAKPMLAPQLEPHARSCPTRMPHASLENSLVSQEFTSAMWTRLLCRVLRQDLDFTSHSG